jgi:hypothetical protein
MVAAAAAAASVTFHRRPDGSLIVYEGDHRHASVMAVSSSSAAPAVTTALVKSRMHQYQLPVTASRALSIGLAGNRLWARWRYLRLTNVSATFFGAWPPSPAEIDTRLVNRPLEADAVIVCDTTTTTVFCDAGRYVADGGTYRVLIDLERTRSLLPPHLYLLLTTGRVEPRGLMQTRVAANAVRAAAAATRCVRFIPSAAAAAATPLVLCEDDVAYFDMQSAANDTVVLGSQFWRRNVSIMDVDGWTGTLWVQFADTVDTEAIELAGVVVALVLATFVMAALTTSRTMLTMSLFLERTLTDEAVRAGGVWDSHPAVTLGALATVALFVVATVLCWLGTPVTSAHVRNFKIVLTVVAAVEAALLTATLALEATERPHHRSVWSWWWKGHVTTVRLAWAQQTAYAATCLLSVLLAVAPLALNTTTSGDLLAFFTLVPILALTLLVMTYFAVMQLAVAFGSRNGTGVLTTGVALVQLALLGTLVGGALPYLVLPLVDSVNPLFGDSWFSMLLALSVLLLPVGGGVLLIMLEGVHFLQRLVPLLAPPAAADHQ